MKLFEIAKISGNLKKEIEVVNQAKRVIATTDQSTVKNFKTKMKARRVIADASPAAKMFSKRIISPR